VRRARSAVAAAIAALVSISAGAAHAATQPPEYCVDRALSSKVVHFRTSDGVRLTGIALGTGSTGVVLGHQLGSDFCDWLPYAEKLTARGYRVLAYSFRTYGSSSDPARIEDRTRLDRDVIAAAAKIRALGARKVVLAGASMGATASLVAAPALRPPAAAVISLSGPTLFGTLDAEPAVRRSRSPALFLAAADDGAFPADAQRLYRASRASAKRVVIVSGAFHGTSLFDGPSAAKVDTAIRTFLAKFAPPR
jgi:pimeloyl-ACP methyl ester carboxylesterase